MNNSKQSAINILDTALNVLKSYGPFEDEGSREFIDTGIDKKIIVRAWKHLEKDGLAYSTHVVNSETNSATKYFISFDGLLAIEDCPAYYKGRPYKWKAVRRNLGQLWKLCSIIAVIINALIIMVFTYLTYIKPS